MESNELNDAAVLDQLREHWQKMLALVLWKTQGMGKKVTITEKDIMAFAAAGPVVFTEGVGGNISFSLVTPEKAQQIAEYTASLNPKRPS